MERISAFALKDRYATMEILSVRFLMSFGKEIVPLRTNLGGVSIRYGGSTLAAEGCPAGLVSLVSGAAPTTVGVSDEDLAEVTAAFSEVSFVA